MDTDQQDTRIRQLCLELGPLHILSLVHRRLHTANCRSGGKAQRAEFRGHSMAEKLTQVLT